jgi:hypothetical protein
MGRQSKEESITLYEKVDLDILSCLITAEELDKTIRAQLCKYRAKVNKKGRVAVKYNYSKSLSDKGRLYADKSLSLQNFKKEIRHCLAKNIYTDIDMVNAHPNIIYQYCKKNNINCTCLENYVNNREDVLLKIQKKHDIDRDAAKKLMLRLVYLGNYIIEKDGIECVPEVKLSLVNNFKDELVEIAKQVCVIEKETYALVKKDTSNKNKKSSVLSITAQVIENKCLMVLYNHLISIGIKVGVFCFDGLMIEPNEYIREQGKKRTTEQNLRKCEEVILNKTGYGIKLEIKPMNLELPFELPLISERVFSDLGAQEQLFRIEGPEKFKYCDKVLYIYDDRTGMYDTDISVLWYYFAKNRRYLEVVTYADSQGNERTSNYGENSVYMKRVLPYIEMAAKDDTWTSRTDSTSLGYLLFKDGIYNMKTGEFSEGFDPNIVFHVRVPWKFPKYNKKYVKHAMNVSFNRLFKNPKLMIAAVACAIAGDYNLKRFYFCPGLSNSGKSRFVNMLVNSFGSIVGIFNAEVIAVVSKGDGREESQKMRWAYLIRYCRILLSCEMKMDRSIDSNTFKKLSSGGDGLIGRIHGGNEIRFYPHFTPFCMLNDIPSIDPRDDAVDTRAKYIEFPYVFVKIEELGKCPYYKELDPDLDNIIKSKQFIKGFIHIILDGYKDYLENGFPEFDQELRDRWSVEDKKSTIVIDIIKENYEVTHNPNDKIDVKEIRKIKNSKKNEALHTISITRINEILVKELGLKKTHSNDVQYWVGLKEKVWGD